MNQYPYNKYTTNIIKPFFYNFDIHFDSVKTLVLLIYYYYIIQKVNHFYLIIKKY